jgi:hypothetical protein
MLSGQTIARSHRARRSSPNGVLITVTIFDHPRSRAGHLRGRRLSESLVKETSSTIEQVGGNGQRGEPPTGLIMQ